MKRSLLPGGALAALLLSLLLPAWARATDFNLKTRDPGPGHRLTSYWWKLNGVNWELLPPEKFALTGGGELRLQKADQPGVAAICRTSSSAERELLAKKDHAAQDKYFRALLPPGIKDVKMVSQGDNPLPVNGLTNFEAVYSYNLGGVAYKATYMVNRSGDDKDAAAQSAPQTVPGRAAAPPPAAKKAGEEFFTAVIVAEEASQGELYQSFQQLLATARTSADEAPADRGGQYVSKGMLGR